MKMKELLPPLILFTTLAGFLIYSIVWEKKTMPTDSEMYVSHNDALNFVNNLLFANNCTAIRYNQFTNMEMQCNVSSNSNQTEAEIVDGILGKINGYYHQHYYQQGRHFKKSWALAGISIALFVIGINLIFLWGKALKKMYREIDCDDISDSLAELGNRISSTGTTLRTMFDNARSSTAQGGERLLTWVKDVIACPQREVSHVTSLTDTAPSDTTNAAFEHVENPLVPHDTLASDPNPDTDPNPELTTPTTSSP